MIVILYAVREVVVPSTYASVFLEHCILGEPFFGVLRSQHERVKIVPSTLHWAFTIEGSLTILGGILGVFLGSTLGGLAPDSLDALAQGLTLTLRFEGDVSLEMRGTTFSPISFPYTQ